ncbi:MAG: aminotransferase class I/II-fold pyridoxal phosphate-dependent enzyme [Candidatus Caldarchaeum sp.]
MTHAPSRRVVTIPSSTMLTFADKIRELKRKGIPIIDLSLGQPEEPPPSHIAEAAARALVEARTEYESSAGLRELREAIAKRLYLDDESEVSPNRVIVTSGAKHALMLSIMAVVDDSSEVLLPTPTFPAYIEQVSLAGASPVYYRLEPDNGWSPNVSEIEGKITAKTRLIILNYPHNPTGWEASIYIIRQILEVAAQHDIYVVSDEPYEKIILKSNVKHYHITHFSEFSERCIMVNSFSKTYGMVAYRLGYLVSPPHLAEHIIKLQRATITNVSPIIQKAGLAALTGPQNYISSCLQKYTQRIAMGLRVLREAGFQCTEPAGGFYLFPKLPNMNINSTEFAVKLLEEEAVAVTPGRVFGPEWDNYVRLAFTASDEKISSALERIVDFISRHS